MRLNLAVESNQLAERGQYTQIRKLCPPKMLILKYRKLSKARWLHMADTLKHVAKHCHTNKSATLNMVGLSNLQG
jgi:hypothetical protein